MTYPIKISSLPLLSCSLAEALTAPAAQLATASDPDLHFGRIALRGSGPFLPCQGAVVIVQHGTLTLHSGAGQLHLVAGAAATIGTGLALSVTAVEGTEIVVITSPRTAFPEGAAEIALEAELTPSPAPAAAILLGRAPKCGRLPLHLDGALSFGLWSATPYARRSAPMPISEVMYLRDGGFTLISKDGKEFSFAAGDIMLSPQGTDLAWRSEVPVRKFWISTTCDKV